MINLIYSILDKLNLTTPQSNDIEDKVCRDIPLLYDDTDIEYIVDASLTRGYLCSTAKIRLLYIDELHELRTLKDTLLQEKNRLLDDIDLLKEDIEAAKLRKSKLNKILGETTKQYNRTD